MGGKRAHSRESGASAQLHALLEPGRRKGSPVEPQGQPLMAAGVQMRLHPGAGSGMPSAILLRLGRRDTSVVPVCLTGYTVCGSSSGRRPWVLSVVPAPAVICSPAPAPESPRARQCPACQPQPPRQPLCCEGPPGLCPRGCGRLQGRTPPTSSCINLQWLSGGAPPALFWQVPWHRITAASPPAAEPQPCHLQQCLGLTPWGAPGNGPGGLPPELNLSPKGEYEACPSYCQLRKPV